MERLLDGWFGKSVKTSAWVRDLHGLGFSSYANMSFCRVERPIRSFEVLTEVCNSWIADKTVNVLMAKKTLLAPKLSRAVSQLALEYFAYIY